MGANPPTPAMTAAPQGDAREGVGGPTLRGRGRPRKRLQCAVSFFPVDDAAKLLRTTPEHLREVLTARFSFFANSRCVGGRWEVSSRDLEHWLGRGELKPLLLLSEVTRLLRSTRARVKGAVHRKRLKAVYLFGERKDHNLRFNWLTIARLMGQEEGGLCE